MPLDHYISQVYLKKFYSPALGNLMHATRKSDLKYFVCDAQSVCRIEDGNTNAYLREDRAVEEFLKSIEPKYTSSLEKVREDKIDEECIYTLAGFVSYITTCSPTGMRLFSEPLEKLLESNAAIMEKKGLLPTPPDSLRDKSFLNEGDFKFEVDPKYPQAIGVGNILRLISTFGNSAWEFLFNNEDSNPFFSSDYPIAIEKSSDPRTMNKIFPLSPKMAIRIIPDTSLRSGNSDLSFSKFRYLRKSLKDTEASKINKMIVQCAEDLVFFSEKWDWTAEFIAKNRNFRIEPSTQKIPRANGYFNYSTQSIAEIVRD